MTKNTPTARERREQALLDLNGQSLQMAVLHQPQPHDLDIRVSRQDDLFYDDIEVRKVTCTSGELAAALNTLKAAGFGAWIDYNLSDRLESLTPCSFNVVRFVIKYVPLREADSEGLGDVLPESIWNPEYQQEEVL